MSAGAATPAFDTETRKHRSRLRAGVGLRPESVGTYRRTVKTVHSLEAVLAKLGTINLKGASGTSWTFDVYLRDTPFKAVGAVYVQSVRAPKAGGGGSHEFIYVGQTGDLSNRPLSHHKKGCFDRHGANALLIYTESNERTRLAIERDLINSINPPCND
jgi:hypothetical protein